MASISDFSVTPEPAKAKEESTFVEEDKKATPLVPENGLIVTPTPAPGAVQTQSPLIVTGVNLGGAKAAPTEEEILDGILGSISDIGQAANLKLMVFGEPGTFKSSLLATAPNNLIIDLEDGLISAKNSPHGVAPNVKSYPWKGFDDFGNLVRTLTNAPTALDWIEVVSIDTFSEMHKLALAEVTEREWRKRPSSNRYVPETEHHVENNERLMRVIRALKMLDRDLIISTHSKTVEPKDKPAKTYADFSESLSNKIMGLMDIVGYMSKKVVDGKLVSVMTTQGNGSIHCKSRIGMPAEMINPTFSEVKAAWDSAKAL